MADIQAILIDPDPLVLKTITSSFYKINPKAQVFSYSSLAKFLAAYKKVNSKTNPEEGEILFSMEQVQIIVADVHATHTVDQELWGRLLNSIYKSHSSQGPAPKFLYTSFEKEDGDLDPYKYHSDIVFNFLVKPLDDLIVEEILRVALLGPGPIQVEGLYKFQGQAEVELIKDIKIERLTELGFRTESQRSIPFHKTARYFGKPFMADNSNSLFAYCYANYQIENSPDLYHSSFSYLGISRSHLAAIRRTIQGHKSKEEYEFDSEPQVNRKNVVLISRNSQFSLQVKDFFAEKFDNIDFKWFVNVAQLSQLVPPESRKDLQLVDENSFTSMSGEFVFKMNSSFDQVFECFPAGGEVEESVKVMGKELSELNKNKNWIKDYLTESAVTTLKSFKDNAHLGDKNVLELLDNGTSYFVNVKKMEMINDLQRGRVVNLTLESCSESETYNLLMEKNESVGQVSAVIYHKDSFNIELNSNVKKILQIFNAKNVSETKYFGFSDEAVDSYEDLLRYQGLDDVFQLPLDWFYVTRKFKMHFPGFALKNSKDNSRAGIKLYQGIRTALPLIVDSVSEVHVSFKYPREIRIGDIRRLILRTESHEEMPEILAICRYCSEVDANTYQCDFLFFAVKDRQLKHIRKWLKQNYIQEKSS